MTGLCLLATAPLLWKSAPPPTGQVPILAVVRTQGTDKPPAAAQWTEDGLQSWAERHSLELVAELGAYLAYPEDLCGLRRELRLARGSADWLREIRPDGSLPGDRVPDGFQDQVAMNLLMSMRPSERPPSSVDDMDFAVGLNGWFQLGDGDKSLWVVVDHSGPQMSLRPGRPEPLRPGEKYDRPVVEWLKFDSFETVTVDVVVPSGQAPSVRDRAEACAAA